MDDGRAPAQRRCGKTWKRPVVEFGESVHFGHDENNAMRSGSREDVPWCPRGPSREIRCRNHPHARWCETVNENRENVGT